MKIGLALSGGGSRAIAFHLGCLHALERRGILDQVGVISCVSGGSVIGAIYAYSDEPFDAFEQRVLALLREGMQWGILRRCLNPVHLIPALLTIVSSGLVALILGMARLLFASVELLLRVVGVCVKLPRPQPPMQRWRSRTHAFISVLKSRLFGKATLPEVRRRDDLEVVINACDLCTSAAFRFGSERSSCYRHGEVAHNAKIEVATAVAASAAFPLLLPAIDLAFPFTDARRGDRVQRVILTDGGVFDSLGTSCFEPGRNPDFTAFAYDLDLIIACDAGHGQRPGTARPFWWTERMRQSFGTVFKKSGDASRKLLDYFGKFDGVQCIHAYLGQQDKRLPNPPADLVTRNEVNSYPTDFAAMEEKDIELLSRRGEQLMDTLLDEYAPALGSCSPEAAAVRR